MTEEKPQNVTANANPEQVPETPPEDKGGKTSAKEGKALSHAEVLAAIEAGEWDASFAKVISQGMIPKERVETIVEERLKRDRDSRKEEAATEALKEQQKFRELYEAEERKVKELSPKADSADRYREALDAELVVRKQNLPPHIGGLLANLDPLEQLSWLRDNADALKASASPRNDDATDGTQAIRAGATSAVERLDKSLSRGIPRR